MKKIILTLFTLLCTFMTGCAEKKSVSPQSYETVQLTFSDTETDNNTYNQTTSNTLTNTTTTTVLPYRVHFTNITETEFKNKPDISISEDKITIEYRKQTQVISNSEERYYDSYTINDYNFDRYPDIFFRFKGAYRENGDYWLWDRDTDQFVYSEELALDDGYGYEMKPDPLNKTLLAKTGGVTQNNRNVVLEWKDGKIIPVSMKTISLPTTDFRTYKIAEYVFDDNGDINKTNSCHINSRTGIKIDDDINTPYLRVTDNSVQLMNGSEILQTMSFKEIFGNDKEIIRIKKLIPGAKSAEFGISLVKSDYDHDGTKDLCIQLSPESADDPEMYIYYLMDKKTGKYSRWDSLSAEGKRYLYDEQEDCLVYCSFEDNGKYSYKWEDDHSVLFKRTANTTDENGNTVFTNYRYDEDGNEYEVLN